MRIANVSGRLTTFVDGQTVDVADSSGGRFGPDAQSVFEEWDDFAEWGRSLGASGPGPVDESALDAPVPRPRQVFAIGLNYAEHAAEGNHAPPGQPTVFTKWPSCIVGARHEVEIPVETTDYEVELVVAISRPARGVSRADALDHVAGFTIGQDLSDRTLQRLGPAPQWGLAKSYTGFGPTGPWLVTLDEFEDPSDLAISDQID